MSIDIIIIVVFFITIHLLANKIIPSEQFKRLRWLSFSGGLAVSYVFVYVLPSLHQEQQKLKDYSSTLTMESELYVIGLLGLLLFYSLEKSLSYAQLKGSAEKNTVFWLQVGFYTLYNMLISYTVVASNVQGIQAAFYGAAIGLHYIAVANDLSLENPDQYNKVGKFVLAFGILTGWGLAIWVTVSSVVQAFIYAFISGAMILNVLKNELPKERNAHFLSFSMAIVSYTSITLTLKYFFEW
ncbi:hypothetical protein [Alkalihalobacterium sp. APHAB7]|uniref:hypothetical protein n=1 Tax=Alkalihalobacterium sp. APHAB7 TaxID=3402081 RepID=UPI003AAAB8BB